MIDEKTLLAYRQELGDRGYLPFGAVLALLNTLAALWKVAEKAKTAMRSVEVNLMTVSELELCETLAALDVASAPRTTDDGKEAP